jgi:alpha-ketoglutarate-dependent taurine dioxygenase
MTAAVVDTRQLESRLRDLAAHESPNSLSILIPTHRTHPETAQDPIRFKNTLDAAARTLEAGGMRSSSADEMLAPLREHVADRSLWQHRAAVATMSASMATTTWPIGLWR